MPEIPEPPHEMHGLIQMHMSQRPDSLRAMQNWMQAMTPDDCNTCGDISAVSVRVTPLMGARLNVYFRPTGYDAEPPVSQDPYRIN